MNDMPNISADVLYFNRKENKRMKLKDCELLNDFLFSKNTFYLTYKHNLFFVCMSINGELVSLWHQKEYENDEKYTPSDAMSIFRKKYIKNNITQEMIDTFIEDPLKYEKMYKK